MADLLILLLVALQGVDYYTTRTIIERGGREVNVVLMYYRDALDRIGVPGEFTWLWSAKLAVAVFLVFAWARGSFSSPVGLVLLLVLIVLYGWVALNNYRVMLILKGLKNG
jgi:hypothetical protein